MNSMTPNAESGHPGYSAWSSDPTHADKASAGCWSLLSNEWQQTAATPSLVCDRRRRHRLLPILRLGRRRIADPCLHGNDHHHPDQTNQHLTYQELQPRRSAYTAVAGGMNNAPQRHADLFRVSPAQSRAGRTTTSWAVQSRPAVEQDRAAAELDGRMCRSARRAARSLIQDAGDLHKTGTAAD